MFVTRMITCPVQNYMHVSLQLRYKNNCDIETALLCEDFNVVEGVDKCQYVELQKNI